MLNSGGMDGGAPSLKDKFGSGTKFKFRNITVIFRQPSDHSLVIPAAHNSATGNNVKL